MRNAKLRKYFRIEDEGNFTPFGAFVAGLVLIGVIYTFWPDKVVPEQRRRKPRENLELAHELLNAAGEFQSGSLTGMDQKATTLLATCGVLLGLGLVTFQQVRTTWAAVLLYVGLSSLLLGLVSGWVVLIPRPHAYPIVEKEFLAGGYRKTPTLAVLLHADNVLSDIHAKNEGQRRTKEKWLKLQFWLLLAGAATLAASFVLKTIGV